MQYQAIKLKPKTKERNSFQLQVGDLVTVANRFFSNRGLDYVDLGVATVRETREPYNDIPPAVQINIKFNPVLVQYVLNGYLKIFGAYGLNEKGQIITIVEIHPVYLELVKTKRARKR